MAKKSGSFAMIDGEKVHADDLGNPILIDGKPVPESQPRPQPRAAETPAPAAEEPAAPHTRSGRK